MTEMTGGCMCGRVRYRAEINDDKAYLCHCRMCQRASGGVSIPFKNLPKNAVRWEREPDYYASSPIARRGYCRECGTSLSFEFPDSENVDVTIGSFDEPGRFRPKHHFGAESMHRPWLNTEGLPEYRTSDFQPLVDRWTKAIGKFPD